MELSTVLEEKISIRATYKWDISTAKVVISASANEGNVFKAICIFGCNPLTK